MKQSYAFYLCESLLGPDGQGPIRVIDAGVEVRGEPIAVSFQWGLKRTWSARLIQGGHAVGYGNEIIFATQGHESHEALLEAITEFASAHAICVLSMQGRMQMGQFGEDEIPNDPAYWLVGPPEVPA